ncbi:hypothetical protein ACBE110449_10060 [Acinetobacter bereziniae]|uniref:Uncharacterized protein n=1 Tax=Acinetobacter bereziniae NIPH 3 TaxID=1217651 RepID=N8YQT7_ACIBZ|nr:hypothetical protein F963_02406 [Acinetobacter bereziniae NIPH 3]
MNFRKLKAYSLSNHEDLILNNLQESKMDIDLLYVKNVLMTPNKIDG